MTELVIAALIAKEQVERQFAALPRQTTRPAVAAAVAGPRAPVRRCAGRRYASCASSPTASSRRRTACVRERG
jgi:hypothetical protein